MSKKILTTVLEKVNAGLWRPYAVYLNARPAEFMAGCGCLIQLVATSGDFTPENYPVVPFLRNLIYERYGKGLPSWGGVAYWNDNHATKEQVAEVLQEALDRWHAS